MYIVFWHGIFVTSVFNDGRGFIFGTIFVPKMSLDRSSPDIQSDQTLQNAQSHPRSFTKQDSTQDWRTTIDVTADKTVTSRPPHAPIDPQYHSAARIAYQKFLKKKDVNPQETLDPHQVSIKKNLKLAQTYQKLAEKRRYQIVKNEYHAFLARREKQLQAEYKEQLEQEAYNRELDKKLEETKRRAHEKKRNRKLFLSFLKGLLAGDEDDPSIPKPFLAILTAYYASFTQLYRTSKSYIERISAVSPIILLYGQQKYKPLISFEIKPYYDKLKAKIFNGHYRQWCQQFVRRIIEKRQRGPPSV